VAPFDTVVIAQGLLDQSGWLMPTTLTVTDNAAAVIVEASLITYNNNQLNDTLTVFFSEPIEQPTFNQPFTFIDAQSNESYDARLLLNSISFSDSFLTVAVDTVLTQRGFISVGDSIFITPGTFITDLTGNDQQHPANKPARIAITEKRPEFDLLPQAMNNPLQIANASVPPAIVKLFSDAGEKVVKQGVVIMAAPDQSDKLGRTFEMSGDLSIFDAVNNPVVQNRTMVFDTDITRERRLYFVWDGRNDAGRAVATGTYVAVMKITDDEGNTSIHTIRLGVKR
jgi:hypothetical protein